MAVDSGVSVEPRANRAMQLGQQQARRVHIAAGDVRVNVDRAGHDDMAGDSRSLCRRLPPVGRRDDAAILEPDVADAILARRRIDDMAATQNCQHGATSETLRHDGVDRLRDRRRVGRRARRAQRQAAGLLGHEHGVMGDAGLADFDVTARARARRPPGRA